MDTVTFVPQRKHGVRCDQNLDGQERTLTEELTDGLFQG